MPVLVYSANQDADEERLLTVISFVGVEICRCIEDLRHRLNVPVTGQMRKIVILVINDAGELFRISQLLELYPDLLLIVIMEAGLFDSRNNIHQLRPKYIAYKDGDFQDVAAVLTRLLIRLQ